MLDWVFSLPWVLAAFLVVAAFVAAALVGMSLTRRLILPRLGPIDHQNEITGAILHGIQIVYGLAAALIAIAVWEGHSEVSQVVSEEAASIAALYRDAAGYPEPARTRLQADLRAYAEDVIYVAWPLQRRGKVPTGGVEIMNRFQEGLVSFEPATEGQKVLHAETLRAYNVLIHARRLRLESVHARLPASMWVVILAGAAITLGSSFFFDVRSVPLHRIMVGLLAGLMGLLIFLITFYDLPYRGAHGISSEAYELIYNQLMKH